MAELDYYKVLRVPSDASSAQIKARYQELAKKLHPDHSGDDNLMSLINEAYATLSNPQKKAEYDSRAKTGTSSSSNTSSTHSQQRPHTQHSQSSYRASNQQSYSQQRTHAQQAKTQQSAPKYQLPKLTPQQLKKQKELQDRVKQLEFWIKYPYILPGIFGLFVIMAGSGSPYVDHATWYVGTVVSVIVFSYFYQQLLKMSLRKVRERLKAVS